MGENAGGMETTTAFGVFVVGFVLMLSKFGLFAFDCAAPDTVVSEFAGFVAPKVELEFRDDVDVDEELEEVVLADGFEFVEFGVVLAELLFVAVPFIGEELALLLLVLPLLL